MDESMGRALMVSDPRYSTARLLTHLFSLLETAHTAFSVRLVYYLTVVAFGNMEKLALPDWFATILGLVF